MPSHHIKDITKKTFNDVLSRYASIAPEKLRALDALRYDTIPAAVASRDTKLLTKSEVEQLVEWKLKHGTFRPKLLQLVQSNPEDAIDFATKYAFSHDAADNTIAAIKALSDLKGVGPATASLLLSVSSPVDVPFFSDELFRWCMWDNAGPPVGWQRKIKYTTREYEALLGKVGELGERLECRAVDAEKVAWVLGKEGVDVGDEGAGGEGDGKVEGKEKLEGARDVDMQDSDDGEKERAEVKGTKRKATASKPLVEGSRKSARTKK